MCVAKSPTIFIFYRLWGKIANRPCCSGYAGWSEVTPSRYNEDRGSEELNVYVGTWDSGKGIRYAYKKNNHKKKQATK